MRKALTIAAREYKSVVRTKSFIISILVMPLMMGGSLIFQVLLKNQGNVAEKRFAVIDRTPGGKLAAHLEAEAKRWNEKAVFDPETNKQIKSQFVIELVEPAADDAESALTQRFELSERVRNKALFGFLEIGADVREMQAPDAAATAGTADEPSERKERNPFTRSNAQSPDKLLLRYQSDSPMYDAFPNWAETTLNDAIQTDRFAAVGIPRDRVRAALVPVRLASKELARRNPKTGVIEDGRDINFLATFAVPFALIILMFMVIMVWSTPLMQGVVEEKSQRIAEVLLGSVRPFDLMAGKLLGNVAVSLTLAVVYLGGAYWAAHRYGFTDHVQIGLIAWFVGFQTLGVLLYGSLFIAIGAAAADMKETQTMLMPVMILACIPMFTIVNVIREPDSTFATAMSFFPPSTPMLMIARQAVPPGLPLWQPVVGILVLLLATTLCVYAAGRVFRVGILMQGKGAKIGDMLRWVLRG